MRSLDAALPRPLDETDGASHPFWSPDGRSVGFFADGNLKRIDLDGGTVQTLSDVAPGLGGTWNRDGVILFARWQAGPIFRIPASGGEPVAVTRFDAQDQAPGPPRQHLFPQFLPDGRHFLYVARGAPSGVYVGEVDGSETRHVVDADAGTAAVYASSGHLLFVRQGTLFAQRFDPVLLSLSGNPFPVAEGVGVVGVGAGSAVSAIVYRTATVGALRRQFVWFDRFGMEIAKVGEPYTAVMGNPAMSPDGRYVAVARTEGEGASDLWLLDTRRAVFTRFTSDPFASQFPVWSPDGSRIVFHSNLNGQYDLYQKATTSEGPLDLLLATAEGKLPNDWSADGRFLLYQSGNFPVVDLWALPMDGDRKPFPIVQTSSDESNGQFSPDGKWIAYQSDETGRFEIYVQPFPGAGGKVRISTNGGAQVRWRRDGRELFYLALDDRLMAVPIHITPDGGSVEPGVPVPLFTPRLGGAVQQPLGRQQYIVSPDGKRFLVNTVVEEATASPITVILNWKAEP